MDECDALPDWAFTDCAAWHRVVASAADKGLHFEVLASWRLDDGDSTRGDTMMCLRVHNKGGDVGTVIVRGRGRCGFDLWLGCRTDTAIVDQLLNWARVSAANDKRPPETDSVP